MHLEAHSLWHLYVLVAVITTLRYLVFAGPAFALFYKWKPQMFAHLRIQQRMPRSADYWREIGWSLATFLIFGLSAVMTFNPYVLPHTQWYTGHAYGHWYTAFSVFMALAIHDLYFYLTHRLMHHPRLFRIMHRTHHLSTNPSPWAAFAFHPLEAFVEAGIVPLLVFVMPINELALLIFLLLMTIFNVIGHLGYEVFPRWLTSSFLGRYINTSTNHNMHHRYFTGNYGLYTRIWDELFGTTNPDYKERLEELQSGRK
jgi:lathosterol oxidase